jgi:cytochrome c553
VRHSKKTRDQVGAIIAGVALALSSLLLLASDERPDHIPSLVQWTPENIATASSGDAFRGLLLARGCEHCHGAEGFSPEANIPNLAGLDKLSIWKELQDFRSHKRMSPVMSPIAEALTPRQIADVAAYYSALPVFSDPQDNRSFPQISPDPSHAPAASHLIVFGDGERGIPPCQSCHGPIAYRPGAPALMNQNAAYVLTQLQNFSTGARANDINMPMRTISGLLTDEERHALADFYGSGLGLQPMGAK